MGCDIATALEVRGADGRWTEIDVVDPDRRLDSRGYLWFGILAGVRRRPGDSPPIASECRGTPEGCTVRLAPRWDVGDGEEDDGISSWVTWRELLDYPHWGARAESWLEATVGDICEARLRVLRASFGDRSPDDCRLVFGFDY
jgi:hypothetical protein